jgi:hypothetical protein
MPQQSYGLQPRVAASATLGSSEKRNFKRNAVVPFSQKEMHKADATTFAVEARSLSLPRVAEVEKQLTENLRERKSPGDPKRPEAPLRNQASLRH